MKVNGFTIFAGISTSNEMLSNCTDNLKSTKNITFKSNTSDTAKAHRVMTVIHKGTQYWKFPFVNVKDQCPSKVNYEGKELRLHE